MKNALSVIVPAAGLSRRMGGSNKLLRAVGSYTSLLDATLEAIAASGASSIVVVTGHEHESVAGVATNHSVRVVHNPRFERGMGTSIKAGVASVPSDHGVMVWPADMPFIRPDSVHLLGQRYAPGIIVRPVYLEQPGHPVLFGSTYHDVLLDIPDAEGARSLLADSSVTRLNVDDPGVVRDLDTPEDFNHVS